MIDFSNPTDLDERQQVEGFAEFISPAFGEQLPGHWLGPDFRGHSEAGTTPEWWRPRGPDDPDLEWTTAAVPRALDTTFTFIGESPNLPQVLAPPNVAVLYAAGEAILKFELGIRRRAQWSGEGWALVFTPRQLHTALEEYERQVFSGVCGVYQLRAPAAALTAGQALRLKVVVQPLHTDAIAWFAVRARTNVLETTPATNAEEIQQLQHELIRLKGIVAGLERQANRQLLVERLPTEDVLVYANGRTHVHEGDMIRLHNGDLLCAMREASEHVSADGEIITVRSTDGGRTWGQRQVIRAHPHTDERSASLCQLRDGTLLANALPQVHYDGHGRFVGGRNPVPGYRGRAEGIYIGRSTDDGHTWDWQEEPIDSAPYADAFTAERIVELDSGRLVMACYTPSLQEPYHNVSILYASDDGGVSWRYLSTIADVPGISLNEPSLLQTRSGRLISVLRTDAGHFYYQAVSDDRGESWRAAAPCAIPGRNNPASLVQLDNGTLLCVHGSRADPVGMYVVASMDDGDTWELAKRRVIRDDLANWDTTYPSTALMPDGRILTVYYINIFHRFFMIGSFFEWEKQGLSG